MENIKELLNGWFNFREWSSHKSEEKQFENKLAEFGTFQVYENFKSFLLDNSVYLVSADGDDLDINEVLSSEEKFEQLLEYNFNMAYGTTFKFEEVSEPIIYGQANDTTEPNDYFVTLNSIKNENDLLKFINNVLSNIGEVTHSSGTKNKFEVVTISKF